MCGIVGYVGGRAAAPILVDCLRRLEYRGYDSAGVAIHDGAKIHILRAVGKLSALEGAVRAAPLSGTTGIGHTRWATHGPPSETNAHPHVAGGIAVIHNGIIENHLALRARLVRAGAKIASDTDTEIIAHLIDTHVRGTGDLEQAVRAALAEVEGSYAIAVVWDRAPDRLVVAKNASPLVLGLGEGENFCGSDVPALLPYTRRMIVLDDGQMAVVTRDGVHVTTLDGKRVEPELRVIDWSPAMAERSGYKHFMLKEIFEQPRAIEDTVRGRLDRVHGDVIGAELGLGDNDGTGFERVYLVACGTSFHAGLVGRYYLERIARVPAIAELASEFRTRDPVIGPRDLVVAISQSGETLDTLMAARFAKTKGASVLALTNVMDGAIPRLATERLYTRAGPEIGVASSKCFTAQVAALLMLAIWLGRRRGTLDATRAAELLEALVCVPQQMRDVLQGTRQLVANLAHRYVEARDVLFLGRGLSFPIALEGALKLKEISYVHAEGYAAGEMKHGPIALIDSHVPVIVVVPRDGWHDKSMGNLQEAKARGGRILAIATEGDADVRELSDEVIELPQVAPEITPLLSVLPLQLYAYYVADLKGTDIDQPRNLAKTVTVE